MSINTLKTAALLGFLTAILLIGGQAIAGRQGLYMALGITAIMNFVSYFFSDKIALMSYKAQAVTETENAEAYARVAPMVRDLWGRRGWDICASAWGCPCRNCGSSPTIRPTPSPPGAIRRMPRWPSPPACCGSWPTMNCRA